MTATPVQGAGEPQTLAEEIYNLMITQGAFFAVDAPIRQSLANLADYLASRHKHERETISAAIDQALRSDSRFIREESGGEVRYTTSRQGAYVPRDRTDTHSFKQRLNDPENPLPIDDISVVVSTSRPAITTVEPVFISDYWQIQAGMVPVKPAPAPEPEPAPVAEVKPAVAAAAPAAPVEAPAPTVVTAPVAPVAEPAPVPVAEAAPVAPPPAEVAPPAPKPVVEAAPVAPPPVEAPPPAPAPKPAPTFERGTAFTLPDGTQVDLRRPVRELLAEYGEPLGKILAERLEQDPLRRIVSFGRKYYPEANVISLGKNDLRKIRDYILERNEPLLDTELIADLYHGYNPRQADYEGFRFSLNYRLHREKDFEFVGVEGAFLWSTKGLPTVGTKRVKVAEMGQITAYLVEGHDDSLEQQSAETIHERGSVTRLLTFFEWEYGVLPLDASLAALLPASVLPDQRSAVIRFESPQHYSNYLVEVRFPTGNRGGWLQGLEEFFREHLVPGAMITIARTNDPHVFTISYEEAAEASERLLTLDEKKNKLGFANLTFYCAVDADQIPSQSRFGRLKNLKAFPMGERRKAEMILEHVMENAGDPVGTRESPRYALTLDEIFVAYNVLRPGSISLLRSLLAAGDAFSADENTPGLFYFTPEKTAAARSDDEEGEESEEMIQPTRRRYGRYSDDDE